MRVGAAAILALVSVLGAPSVIHAENSTSAAPPVPVTAEAARREDVPIYRIGIGTVQASNSVTARAQVDGQLQQVLFTEGQTVKRGDLLAVIDPRPFQAALDQAQAKLRQNQALLANAQLNLSRYAKLATESFTPQQTLDNQKAQVAQLQAQVAGDQAAVDNATTQLSYTRITSPLDGRTGLRLVDQGNIIRAGDANGLVVVNQIQPISVVSTLPSADLADVRAAQTAGRVAVTAFDDTGRKALADGELKLVDNSINPATATVILKSEFPNRDTALWPGQSVRLRVLVRTIPNAVTVSSGAIQRGPNGEFAYVVRSDDTVEPRPVKVASITQGRAIIETGLTAGDRVVVAGQYRLTAGTRVAIRSADAAPVATD